jgi:hypothetical protein
MIPAREPTCRICGCTEFRACPEGCYWADEDMTLCSECYWIVDLLDRDFDVFDRHPPAIIALGYGLAAERVFGLPTDEEILKEMSRFEDPDKQMPIGDELIRLLGPDGRLFPFFDPTLGEEDL